MDQTPLAALGWSSHFLRQIELEELQTATPARLTAIHRDRVAALGADGPLSLTLPRDMAMADLAVGDFVLHRDTRIIRLLDRASHLSRRAPGSEAQRQLIAANVDALGIVTSCNADFNIGRIERYLAMARAGGVSPLVVLTKADLSDPAPYLADLAAAFPDLPVLPLNALHPDTVEAALAPWAGRGRTLALAGSSGVGKTTIANALTGEGAVTRGIREDDARGRHTTTARHMAPMRAGGWLIDTPGMRELQLEGAAAGLAEGFADIEALALTCRFTNCGHDSEPGCAVQAALEDGSLGFDRLRRWQKLLREDAMNSRTLAQSHAVNRAFGKRGRKAMADKRARQEGWTRF